MSFRWWSCRILIFEPLDVVICADFLNFLLIFLVGCGRRGIYDFDFFVTFFSAFIIIIVQNDGIVDVFLLGRLNRVEIVHYAPRRNFPVDLDMLFHFGEIFESSVTDGAFELHRQIVFARLALGFIRLVVTRVGHCSSFCLAHENSHGVFSLGTSIQNDYRLYSDALKDKLAEKVSHGIDGVRMALLSHALANV